MASRGVALLIGLIDLAGALHLERPTRRAVIGAAAAVSCPSFALALPGWDEANPDYNLRPRGMNQDAMMPNDYYGIYGVVPPRKLLSPSVAQPQWNAFGACIENSCTYVPIAQVSHCTDPKPRTHPLPSETASLPASLSQRYAAYQKYEVRLARGLRAYTAIGASIQRSDWDAVAAAVVRPKSGEGTSPPPAIDALLKAGLLASALLVSPNNLREKKEASLATFYVNEASYALDLLASAAKKGDGPAAVAAWLFGRDSWNSYLSVVNRAIVPKVGEPFETLPE